MIHGIIPPRLSNATLRMYEAEMNEIEKEEPSPEAPPPGVMTMMAMASPAPESDRKREARMRFEMQKVSCGEIDEVRVIRGTVPKHMKPQSLPIMGMMAATGGGLGMNSAPIEIWNVKHPGQLVFSTQPDTKNINLFDTVAKNVMNHTLKTDLFFRSVLKEYPIPIVPLNSTKQYLMRSYTHMGGWGYNNAAWSSGTHSIYYGEVDERIYRNFSTAFDIVVHEWGHALTDFTSDFNYKFQSGALSESLSDVWGAVASQWKSNIKDPNEADWLIGKVFTKEGRALRSMKNPGTAHDFTQDPWPFFKLGKDDQPDHWNDFKRKDEKDDHGGVHTYSGIPNKAFYLTCSSEQGPSWQKPAQIWLDALKRSSEDETFSGFAAHTIAAAKNLHPGVESIVRQAWTDVGVVLPGNG